MGIKLIDTIEPKGNFPIAEAKNIERDGVSIDKLLPKVFESKEEYEAAVAAGEIDDDQIYFVKASKDVIA